MLPPVRSSVLLGLALLLPASQVECSRARRRHHSAPAAYTDGGRKTPSISARDEMIREDSSIPGVSIWTSKTAAALSRRPTGSGDSTKTSATDASYCHRDGETPGFAADCQVSWVDMLYTCTLNCC